MTNTRAGSIQRSNISDANTMAKHEVIMMLSSESIRRFTLIESDESLTATDWIRPSLRDWPTTRNMSMKSKTAAKLEPPRRAQP